MLTPSNNKNDEKAQAMLNRWWRMKRMLYQQDQEDRPNSTAGVTSITDCDKWRQDIIKEISDKVADIQNAGLGEHKIRALNDEINQLLEEKRRWDKRIRELGGPDYAKLEVKLYDRDGVELPGSGGYKYFGAAKDLPGVRELFYVEPPAAPKRNINDLHQQINYEYYGLMQNGDDYLKPLEDELSATEREESIRVWIQENHDMLSKSIPNFDSKSFEEICRVLQDDSLYEAITQLESLSRPHDMTPAPAASQTAAQEAEALEEKKKMLIEKYLYEIDN